MPLVMRAFTSPLSPCPHLGRPHPGRRATLLAPLLLLLSARRAMAHAVIVSSSPVAGSTIPVGQTRFELRFNSRIDHGRSRVVLMGPDGNQTVLSIDPAGEQDMITATAIVSAGGQSLRWQVLAADGHITRGEIPFKAAVGN
jgi:methionine-rich copper-binding protein CopC